MPDQETPNPVALDLTCEVCGQPGRWCCDDRHEALCQAHYESLCKRLGADPIDCPHGADAMRWRPENA